LCEGLSRCEAAGFAASGLPLPRAAYRERRRPSDRPAERAVCCVWPFWSPPSFSPVKAVVILVLGVGHLLLAGDVIRFLAVALGRALRFLRLLRWRGRLFVVLLNGLVVTDVPKVPIWKAIDFNVLRRGMCGNSLISGKSQLFSAQHEVFGDRGRLAKQVDL